MSLSCTNCSTAMTLNNRLGVEIDQCPRCKGVWLDRGELDKLQICKTDMKTSTTRNIIMVEDMTMMMMITIAAENTKKEAFWGIYLTLAEYHE